MSMLKGMVTGLVSCLLVAGGLASSESNRLVASLFIHYLGGSGEGLTVKSPNILNTYCPQGTVGVVSTYDTPYEWALGDFTCTQDGAGYDVYDFEYAGQERRMCRRIAPRRYAFYALRGVDYALYMAGQFPADAGRCIVGKGYGKPFKINITK